MKSCETARHKQRAAATTPQPPKPPATTVSSQPCVTPGAATLLFATAAKHGIRHIGALTQLAERRPWQPAAT